MGLGKQIDCCREPTITLTTGRGWSTGQPRLGSCRVTTRRHPRAFRRRKTSLITTSDAANYFTMQTGIGQKLNTNDRIDPCSNVTTILSPSSLPPNAPSSGPIVSSAAAPHRGSGLVVVGTEVSFHFAHRCLSAPEIRLRAAVFMRGRGRPVVEAAVGGRLRRAGA